MCFSFAAAASLRAEDVFPRSVEWFSLRQQAAEKYETGALNEAEALLSRALEISRSSTDDVHRLASLRELGMVYERAGKFADAKKVFHEAITLQQWIHGPEHLELAITLNYLGVAQRELKEFRASIESHERALKILDAQGSASENVLATTHLALGMAYDGLDLSKEPEEHYRKALEYSKDGRGLQNTGLTRVFIRLSRLSADRGSLREAEQFLRRAETVMNPSATSNSPERMAYFDTRAALSFYQGKYTEAERNWREANAIGEALFGSEDPNVVTMLLRRGELHLMIGEHKEALAILQTCLAIRERVLPANHPDIAVVLTHLAVLHTRKREYVEAAKLFERTVQILQSGARVPNLHMAFFHSAQGEFYMAQGAWGEAAKAYRQSLELREATLGKSHPAVLEAMWAYAQVLVKNKQKDEAKLYEERVRAAMGQSADLVAAGRSTVDVRALRAAHSSGRF
jgi:tetratricopeptide (TPR) repeat protein